MCASRASTLEEFLTVNQPPNMQLELLEVSWTNDSHLSLIQQSPIPTFVMAIEEAAYCTPISQLPYSDTIATAGDYHHD